jgi:hypothetical protein
MNDKRLKIVQCKKTVLAKRGEAGQVATVAYWGSQWHGRNSPSRPPPPHRSLLPLLLLLGLLHLLLLLLLLLWWKEWKCLLGRWVGWLGRRRGVLLPRIIIISIFSRNILYRKKKNEETVKKLWENASPSIVYRSKATAISSAAGDLVEIGVLLYVFFRFASDSTLTVRRLIVGEKMVGRFCIE